MPENKTQHIRFLKIEIKIFVLDLPHDNRIVAKETVQICLHMILASSSH